MVVLFAAAPGAVDLGLQQERTVDHDGLTRAKAGHDLDLAVEIATSTDLTDLEGAGLLRGQEDGPAVAHALHGVRRHRHDGGVLFPDRDARSSGHPGSQQPLGIIEVHAHTDGPRHRLDLTANSRDPTVEAASRQRSKCYLCDRALPHA